MIQATELRIGNIVSLIDRRGEVHIPNGITYKIYSINILTCVFCDARLNFAECQQSDFFDVDISDLSPIPLTEEILLKCDWNGFKAMHFNSYFEIDTKGCIWYCGDFTGIVIKHLHSLQNLYFALTNTELNITL